MDEVVAGRKLLQEAAEKLTFKEQELASACERCNALSSRCAAMAALGEAEATQAAVLRHELAGREAEAARANATRLELAGRERAVYGLEVQLVERTGQVKELQWRLEESEQGGRHMGAELASEQALRLKLQGQVKELKWRLEESE